LGVFYNKNVLFRFKTKRIIYESSLLLPLYAYIFVWQKKQNQCCKIQTKPRTSYNIPKMIVYSTNSLSISPLYIFSHSPPLSKTIQQLVSPHDPPNQDNYTVSFTESQSVFNCITSAVLSSPLPTWPFRSSCLHPKLQAWLDSSVNSSPQ